MPYQGFNEEVRKIVLGSNPEPEEMENLDKSNFEMTKLEAAKMKENRLTMKLYRKLYPKVWMDYFKHKTQLPVA